MAEFAYQDMLPLGADDTPYRLLTSDYVTTFEAGGRALPARSTPRRSRCSPARRCTTSRTCCGPATSRSSRAILDDPEASPNDRVRRARAAEERVHRRGRRAAVVPGHRHRDREGQEGRAGAHRRRRPRGDRARHLPHLRRRQPALLAARAARRRTREEHRHEPARRDRDRSGRRRRVQVAVHGQGRRLGEQEPAVPGDQGAAQPRQR